MFLRSNRLLERLKRDFDDCMMRFFSVFKAGYRFLISTWYFADLDSLSAENIIGDLLSSVIFDLEAFYLGPRFQYISLGLTFSL